MNKIINKYDHNFYLSNEEPCSYISNKKEKKIFTIIDDPQNSHQYETLIKHGFRRSHNILYNQVCDKCNLCKSLRINCVNFKPSKSQKRILNKNQNIYKKKLSTKTSLEQFKLFKKYLEFKHQESEMNEMNYRDYKKMLDAPGINTHIYEYYLNQELVACVISDFLDNSVSMVYSFYSKEFLKFSIGKYMILDHFNLAKKIKKKYVYLGYWVEGCEKMDYKSKFNSSEILINNTWKDYLI
tara:strand:+ start:502 stop:1221 length:720 start_codon:yes stop_codon:yes gene_type:complete